MVEPRPTSAGAPVEAPRAASTDPRWLGWVALAAVTAFPLVEATRIIASRARVVLYGDQALLALGARRAAGLDQLVGPYSREGFHHPGPAVFYLLAPFVRLFGSSGTGLYLGAVAINGAALLAVVAVIWRRFGPLAAVWAAAAIDLFCLCVRVGTLREPWNPYLVVVPTVLFVVLWAGGLDRSVPMASWALVVGSYLVQTEVATGPFVVVMLLVLAFVVTRRHRRDRSAGVVGRTRGSAAWAAAMVILALMWVPPVVELWRDHPDNLSLMGTFLTAAHSSAPLGRSLRAAAAALTIVPFGNHDYVLALDRGGAQLAAGAALTLVGLAVVVLVARRRRQPAALGLGAGALLGVVVGTASVASTPGPLYAYLTVWLAFVPLCVLLAIGIALVGPASRYPTTAPTARVITRRRLTAACVVTAVVAGALTVQSDLRMGSISTTTGSGPWPAGNATTAAGRARTVADTAALTRAAAGVLGPADHRVALDIVTPGLWPYAAGIVTGLDDRGVQSTVSPASWVLYFGHERAPGRPVTVTFDLYAADDDAARRAASGPMIADVHGEILTYHRSPG